MKPIYKLPLASCTILMLLIASGCNDLLTEAPKAALTPAYYKTGAGLTSGLTSVYSSFKYYYGTEGGMNLSVYGTDEFTHGQQVTNPPLNVYNNQLNSTIGDVQTPWNRSYPAINTCNAIIDLGPETTDLSATAKQTLIAEAKYLRAHWYFILVTTFGGVTLDLGSGNLKFNTNATIVATRASLADCYAAIITDLTQAVAELPNKPTAQGHAWKASALHLLAKVYLTRGWSSVAQSTDFTNAYNTAKDLIDNRATYGVALQADYSAVHREGNEYSSEVLFQVDWINNNQTFNNNNGFAGGEDGLRQNRSNFLFRCLYVTNTPGVDRDVVNGRPFVRYKPTPYLLETAFADKVNDTRYAKSFQTVWYCNLTTGTRVPSWTAADVGVAYTQKNTGGTLNLVTAADVGKLKLAVGDTAIFMVPSHLVSKFLPRKGKTSYVMFFPNDATNPSQYFGSIANSTFTQYGGYDVQNQYYPSLSKYNSTQSRAGASTSGQLQTGDPNVSSVRPFIVHRFAETYLIAAEAALQGGGPIADATNYVNVVRARAGVGGGNSTALTAATPSPMTIDFILDERSRELAGEQMRWFDLVRTNKFLSRMALYNNFPATPGTISVNQVLTPAPSNIPAPQAFHMLRPIPQAQIDGSTDPSKDNGKYQQNPGYN